MEQVSKHSQEAATGTETYLRTSYMYGNIVENQAQRRKHGAVLGKVRKHDQEPVTGTETWLRTKYRYGNIVQNQVQIR